MLRLVLCNCSPEESKHLAETLVRERLAACVNVLGPVTSYYVWEGEFCEDTEHTLLIKTTAARWDALRSRLDELHSYATPEIVAFDSVDALDRYAAWAVEATNTMEGS